MTSLRAGDKVGKYELLHPIGEGGMGEVWVARLRSLGGFESYVGVKVIHGRFAREKRFRDMFLDEARVSAAISHPNVVSTQDVAVEGEMLYQVMEYVDGDSLSSLQAGMAERGEKMPLPVALRIAAEVSAGLHAAHEVTVPDGRHAGLVHRDVSPQNILLGVNGAVKLIDFGVALMQDRLAEDSQGSLKGKLRYMPQEQAKGEVVDRRADVYAMGAVLYEMVAGRLPYDDRTEALYFRSIIQGDAPEPLPPEVPEDVSAVVMKAMHVDRDQRFATAEQLAEELFAMLRKRPANIASFVEIHLSPHAQRRRQAIRSSAASARGETSPHLTAHPNTLPEAAPSAPATSHEPDLQRAVSLAIPSGQEGLYGAGVQPSTMPSSHAAGAHGMPEVPSLDLDRQGKKSSSARIAQAPITAQSPGPGVSPSAASVALPRPTGPVGAPSPHSRQSPPSAHSPHSPPTPSRVTTMMEPTPVRVAAVTGTNDRSRPGIPAVTEDVASKKASRAVGRALAIVGVVALVIVGIVLALPVVAKRKVILAARERGLELEIGGVGVGLSGIELDDVRATGAGLPLKSATLTSVKIATNGAVTIQGLDGTMEGLATDLPAALARLAGPKGPFAIDVTSANIVWNAPIARGTAVELHELRFAFTRDEEGEGEPQNVTAYAPDVTFTSPLGKAGPFTLNVDESEGRKRARLVFEARKAEGPNVFVIFGGLSAPTHVTVRIPKSKLSQLHVPPAYLGLAATDDPELDVLGTVAIEPEGRVKGTAKANIGGMTFAKSRTKTPVDLEMTLFAEPGRPVEITKGVASYGPITADFSGVVTRDPIAGDIRFVSKPLPCSYFVGAEAKKSFGVVGQLAVDLFGRAVKVTGAVNVRGTYTFSLPHPETSKLNLDVRDTCGVALFGN